MPTCSEAYGPGWVGEYPNCRYDPSTPAGQGGGQAPFTGTVGSLGYGDILAGSSWEDDWQKFFDPYDITGEEQLKRRADIDVGQLEEAWGLQTTQLGETLELGREQQGEAWRGQSAELGGQWGAQQQQLGTQARRGFQDVTRMGQQRQVQGRGLKFGEQRQRQAEEEVSGAYKSSFGLGQSAFEQAMRTGRSRYMQGLEAGTSAYEQAMGTGQLALQQGTTDIYQGLESDIFGRREDWLSGERGTLNVLLGSGIWDGTGGNGGAHEDRGECPPGHYMPLPDSGLSGCQPITGGWTPTTPLGETFEPEYTNMGEEDICISKGGYWTGSSCEYE